MLEFLRSRQWIIGRRLALLGIILILAIERYGSNVITLFQRPHPERDITITRAEFRPDLQGAKPGWIIGFRNDSNKFTYDVIRLEATYMDDRGKVLERDTLKVRQKLPPGDEKIIGSSDIKSRGTATSGTLKVLGADAVK